MSKIKKIIKSQVPDGVIYEFSYYLNYVSLIYEKNIKSLYVNTLENKNLRKIARVTSTDKQGRHSYVKHYEKHFDDIRNSVHSILEIGVGGGKYPSKGGGSLRLWKKYFPEADIYGVDIHDKTPIEEERIKTFVCNQSKKEDLERVAKDIGSIDIIIDDGSHINSHVIKSFKTLFKHLNKGGFYVVEDLHTAYRKEYGGAPRNNQTKSTSMGFIKSLVDGLNYKEFEKGYTPNYFDKHIESFHFYPKIAFIKKKKYSSN